MYSTCNPPPGSPNMATQFFKNILSIFSRKPARKERSHSLRTINGVFGHWATSTAEDVLPPYTDSPQNKSHFHDEKHPPPPPFASPRLQICSHESLSFEDLQKIAKSLAIGNIGGSIDALTPSCHEHRSQSDYAAENTEKECVSSPGLLRGSGAYSSQVSTDPSHTPSVILRFHWDLGSLDGVRAQVETAAELQQFLRADGVWLCPHKQICDLDVINAIYGFVKKPSWREVTTDCDHCATEIKICTRMEGGDETCRVTTKRYLGTVETPNDPTWLAQCGV